MTDAQKMRELTERLDVRATTHEHAYKYSGVDTSRSDAALLREASSALRTASNQLTAGTGELEVMLMARAIAENGFGRSWDDFHPVDAHGTDQGDLIEYAQAAVAALTAPAVSGDDA
jgi:hypothetical protein